MTDTEQPGTLASSLPQARFTPYLTAATGDLARAEALYRWNARLSGAWHVHLGYVEVALRHTMDQQIQHWNASQRSRDDHTLSTDWTAAAGTAPVLHAIIGQAIDHAREAAQRDADLRPTHHERNGLPVTHDDVVAQLMFGAWTRLLRFPGARAASRQQRRLWDGCLAAAFPNSPQDHMTLEAVGRQLESLRRLRNRVAHHENLLSLDTRARLNGSLALLRLIDKALPEAVMHDSRLRVIAREDPRAR